ncbi:ester cyclase [uncultured Cohaesibacter sp.]|uniref:ester cyclase n=1 Tax=uncultured Cohaesibacter sp. TaxID=1002546 RepID=UPI0029C97BCB|nr:ester cyclase [uncultured Cohaesibacter sp.]
MKSLLKAMLSSIALISISFGSAQAADDKSPVPQALKELAQYQAQEALVAERLATFDTLDFEVFSGQQWVRLHESHADEIVVHWPDGRAVKGLDQHIDDLKAFFVFAPDTKIDMHPIRIGQGEWTGVVGEIGGTFTEPMPIGEGKFIQPTGKAYKLTMATIGHWTKDGVMDEEYLFWDNNAFYKQIGLID